jgi:hypothetical protein
MNEERGIIIASEAGISIRTFSDIPDAIGACLNAKGLIFTEDDLAREFFDLRSGIAGELFQKFMNYKLRAAIAVPDPTIYGERFSELAYEHASHGMIRILRSKDEAVGWLDSYS